MPTIMETMPLNQQSRLMKLEEERKKEEKKSRQIIAHQIYYYLWYRMNQYITASHGTNFCTPV